MGIVDKAIPVRTSMPILENMLIELNSGELKLTGNDLEIGIQNSIRIENESTNGSVLVKSKILLSILSKLQNQTVQISVDENNSMSLKSENVDFDILCSSKEGYPEFPSLSTDISFDVKVSELRDLIKHTIFSVSMDETKQFLNGILIKNEGNDLFFVSTDGYRLSLKKHTLESIEKEFYVIVPYKAMNELNKIIQVLEPDKIVQVKLSDTQVSFALDSFLMISRIINGKFPDYNQVLPKQTENIFTLSRRICLEAAERASIIATSSNNVVRFIFEGDKLGIKANAIGLGEFYEEIAITRISGEGEVRVAFDVKLLLEALRNIESDEFKIKCNDGATPFMFEPISEGDYMYVIMPIRANEFQPTQVQKEQPVTA